MHQGAIARILNNPLGIEFVQFLHFYFIYIDEKFLDLIFLLKSVFCEILTSIFAELFFITIKCKIIIKSYQNFYSVHKFIMKKNFIIN